jgi:DNA-binding NtrC family response regulator
MTDFRILIVEDDPIVRSILTQMVVREGYQPDVAVHGLDALRLLTENRYDLALLDLFMEPVGGLEVLKLARQQDPDVVVIIITAHSSLESAVEALRLGAFDYIFKPFSL